MSLDFDQVQIFINSSGIAAENATISSQNALIPTYTLGRKFGLGNKPSGPIQNNISINYLQELHNLAALKRISYLKTGHEKHVWEKDIVAVAGLTGNPAHLESYQLKISPNSVSSASVSYVSFYPLSGQVLTTSPPTGNFLSSNFSGLSHSWNCYIGTTGGFEANPVYDFSYNFKAKWEPIYQIGSKYPYQTHFLGAEEQMSFTRDVYHPIEFSGENAINHLSITPYFSVDLVDLSILCDNVPRNTYQFNLSGAKVIENQVEARTDDIVRVTTTIIKNY